MAGKKGSKKTGGTDSKKPKKEKKGKKDKKSKSSKKGSAKSGKLGLKDSEAGGKRVIPWSHEAQIQYRLSDPQWVQKGWTVLPKEKIIHKVVTYKTVVSKPHMLLFKKRRRQITRTYANGEPLAVLKKNGLGSIFYPDGRVAVTCQSGRKCNRLIVFSPSKLKSDSEKLIEPGRGRSESPRSSRNASRSRQREASKSPRRKRVSGICAMFDSWGNGVVYDEDGNIRLNYTQRAGILLDGPSGLPVKWQWPVRFTKGDSVENLGTQEQMDVADSLAEEKDSDDEEEKKVEEVPEQKDKKSKGKKGSSKGKGKSVGKKGSKSKKKSSNGSKSSKGKKGKKDKSTAESKAGKKSSSKEGKQKKKGDGSSKDSKKSKKSDSTPKGKKKKKGKSAGGDEQGGTSEDQKEPEGAEQKPGPDIAEDTGKMADGRGDELEDMDFEPEVGEDIKKQLSEIYALRDKYSLPGIAPLKPIVLKINDFLSVRILDQANISLVFHAHTKMIRLELGCVVDPSEKIKVNKVDPVKWFVDNGVPCQIELFAKRSMNRYKKLLNHQREVGTKRLTERRQNEKRFGGPYLK